ncbi:hypothetical protein [Streptomyces sp. NPDC059009]|uniref:hypothetical protein n=1 Tax=Streptomyces sp. NPDC059009 TaxID=3346694 RepID=UPI00369CDEC9
MHTEREHVRGWLSGREHWILERETSEAFNDFLCRFPWTTSRVRWSEVPHTTRELPEAETPDLPEGDDDWSRFLTDFRTLPAGRHDFVFLMYAWREPGIVCATADALQDLDHLYSSAPGPRYFCGADVSEGVVIPVFGDFAEYDDGGGTVTAFTGETR